MADASDLLQAPDRVPGTGPVHEARVRKMCSASSRRRCRHTGFYRFAVIDGAIEASAAEYVRRPKIETESATLSGNDKSKWPTVMA